MSKQISAGLALLIVFCLGTGSFLPKGQAQTGAARRTPHAAIVSMTAEMLRETSELRELSILRSVKSGAQSRSEIERTIIKNLDSETTPAEMHASEVLLKVFGLAPKEFAYRAFIIKLLTEQVAGYYDPKAQQFYLADWIDLEGQEPVMAHELTHALQDQHFNLRRFENWPKGDSDAELAVHAVIEGDATFTMIRYMWSDIKRALAFAKSMESNKSSSEQIDNAPRALRESLLFPYEQGTQWCTSLYGRGGWARISQAFTELPQSTEQILHPEKYFKREAPIKIEMMDVSRLLGSNWKRVDYDVNGEWSYYLILAEFLKAESVSKRAAAGWGGARYAVYTRGTNPGDVFIAQLTAWDSESDAVEFFDAYAKRTERRYRDASEHDMTSMRRLWQTSEGAVIME